MVSAHLVADSVPLPPALPDPRRRRPGPTRLRLPDLLHATDQAADDVLSGRYDHLLSRRAVCPTDDRWFTRLHGDDELDVWLISWVPGHRTELHDHGGSLGALTVLSGSLNEFRWDGRAIAAPAARCRGSGRVPAGLGARRGVGARPARALSGDRRCPGPGQPTLSVHAYSPPLTAMSYYEVTDAHRLRRTAHRTDRPTGRDVMSRIDRVLESRATGCAGCPPTRCPQRCAAARCWSTSGRRPSGPAKARCRGERW